jgi:hypothetical protein
VIRVIDMTNDGDHCGECGDLIDISKRVYRGPSGYLRCPLCQVLAEREAELTQLRLMLEVIK